MSTTPDPNSDCDFVVDPVRPGGDVALAAVLHRRTCRPGGRPESPGDDGPARRFPATRQQAADTAIADRRRVGYRPGWTPAVYQALTGRPSGPGHRDTAAAALARYSR